jgi:stromal membrane-associated protein
MGTHISKVKSVDLDTWTDEQLQSVLKWGNARANKYWEAKLAPGHVPSEAKIENFIRTKYESKRWTMDGPIPDPSTLEADDDDMVSVSLRDSKNMANDGQPLKKVQEKVQLERSASQRLGASSSQPPAPQARPQPTIDLFGDEAPAPQRPSTGPPVGRAAPPPKAEPAPPKQTKAGDSLLGLDFLGGGPTTQPARPSSTGPAASAAPSRPDLKQSILSLYASKPAAPPQPQQHARQESFGGMASPQGQTSPQQSSFGGMNDAFSSLSFNQAAQPAAKPSPFSGLDSFTSTKSPPTTSSSNMFGGGGNFFDSKPKAPSYTQAQNRTTSPSSGLSDFSSFSSPAQPKPAASSSGLGDLLDLSMPSAPAPAPHAAPASMASPPMNSAFNLSSPTAPSAPAPTQSASTAAPVNYGGMSNMDAWGSNDVWGSSAPSQPAATTTTSHAAPKSPGWGAPQVTQDDDFGGWSSAAPTTSTHTTTTTTNTTSKPAGGFGGGSDDLFSNVWE